MFAVSLKRRQQLEMLLDLLRPLESCRCLLLTLSGDTGSLNYHLCEAGGVWSWAELDVSGVPRLQQFVNEPVVPARPDALPFPDGTFERVVVVDVHAYLPDSATLNREIARVLVVEGVAIVTTPNGAPGLPVTRIRRLVGMDDPRNGRAGHNLTSDNIAALLGAAGLRPAVRAACSKFFTEFADLAIELGYAKVLDRRRRHSRPKGDIVLHRQGSPSSESGKYQLYRRLYPVVQAFSSMDRLVPGRDGYTVAVAALKDA